MPVIHTWVRSICAENDFADGDASVIDYASEIVSATTNGLYRYKCTHTLQIKPDQFPGDF